MHELLIRAALNTEGVLAEPRPFVLETSLNDFHISYEMNAYTNRPNEMHNIYSGLHESIQDSFNKAGVEIMSPTFYALRDGNTVTTPAEHRPADYEAPSFRVRDTTSEPATRAHGHGRPGRRIIQRHPGPSRRRFSASRRSAAASSLRNVDDTILSDCLLVEDIPAGMAALRYHRRPDYPRRWPRQVSFRACVTGPARAYYCVKQMEKDSQMSPKTDLSLKDDLPFPLLRFLQGAACTVIVLWGVRAFSEILGPLVLGIGLAYTVTPFPSWLMQRFKLSKSWAAAVTAVILAAAGLFAVLTVDLGVARMAARLPVYEERLTALNEQIQVFLNAHGVEAASFSFEKLLTAERLSGIAVWIVPQAGAMIARVLFIVLLALLFVIEMLPGARVEPGLIAASLARHVSHTKRYLAVNAETGAINVLVNLVFLLAMGVDGAVLWCFLYFFLNFIPHPGLLDCTDSAHLPDAPDARLDEGAPGGRRPDPDQSDRRQRRHADVCEACDEHLLPRTHVVAGRLGVPPRSARRHRRGSFDPGVEGFVCEDVGAREDRDRATRVTSLNWR